MTMQTWEQIRQWRKQQRDALIERRISGKAILHVD